MAQLIIALPRVTTPYHTQRIQLRHYGRTIKLCTVWLLFCRNLGSNTNSYNKLIDYKHRKMDCKNCRYFEGRCKKIFEV